MAGCSQCGQGKGYVPPPSLTAERPMTNGTYDLANYPDCHDPYQGDRSEDWVYVVGIGTEHERMFRSAQKNAMVSYYNSFNPPIDLFFDYAERFCTQAIEDLLAS